MSVKSVGFSSSRLLLYIVVVVVINLAIFRVPTLRLDLTAGKTFTLSSASKEMLSNLEEPLTVRAYLSQNLPSGFNNLSNSLRDLLQIYSAAGNKNFSFQINTIGEGDEAAALIEEAQSYGIYQANIQGYQKNEFKQVAAYLGLAIIQGDSIETLSPITTNTNLEYEVTSAIRRLSRKSSAFLQLPAPIDVLFYFSPILSRQKADWANLSRSYQQLVEDELSPQFYGQVRYQLIDPTNSPPNLPTAGQLGLASLMLGEGDARQQVFASLVLKKGDQTRHFNLMQKVLNLNSLFGGQEQYNIDIPQPAAVKDALAQSIEQLVGVNQKISYVSDLGTPPLRTNPYQQQQMASDVNLNKFTALLNKSYDIGEVKIADGIPQETSVLLLLNPTSKLNEWQLYQLDQYLMYGGALALMISPYRTVVLPPNMGGGNQPMTLPNPNLTPGTDGKYSLADLLKHYGIEVSNSMLFDKQSYINRSNQGGYREQQIYYLPELRNANINPNIKYISALQQLFYDRGAALVLDEKVATPLLWSSEKAWIKKINMQENPGSIYPPADSELKRYPLVALREGLLTSFFAERDKPSPAAPEKPKEAAEGEKPAPTELRRQAERAFKVSSEDARLLVAGSGRLLDDSLLAVADNATLMVNLINVVSGNEAMANLRAKGKSLRLIEQDVSNKLKNFIIMVNLIGTAVVVGIIGVIIYFVWMRRRRRIAAMFTGS